MSDLVKRGRHPIDPTGEVYGDHHWPLPTHYDFEPTMHIAINRDTMTFIGLGEYRMVWHKAEQEGIPPNAIVIGEANAKRTYSALTDMELKMLYRNTTGYQHDGFDYSAMIQSCRALGLALEPLPTPSGLLKRATSLPQEKTAPTSRKTALPAKVKGSSGPIARPKPGTATGQVWDIADQVVTSMPDSPVKALRAEIIKRATEAGINPATAQVQYGKWKASKSTDPGS